MVYEANDDSSSSPKSNLRASSDRKLQQDSSAPWEQPSQRYATGKVVIARKTLGQLMSEGKSQAAAAAIRAQGMAEIKRNKVVYESKSDLSDRDLQVVELPKGQDAPGYINRITNGPLAELFDYVELEYMEYPTITVPSDGSQYNNQWHHRASNMRSELAWDLTTGSSNVTVAICDTGIDLTHSDLTANRLEGYQATTQLWESQNGDVSAVHPHGKLLIL